MRRDMDGKKSPENTGYGLQTGKTEMNWLISTLKSKLHKSSPVKKILVVSLQKSGTHLINNVMQQIGYEGIGVGKGCRIDDFKGLNEDQYLWTHFTPSDDVQMLLEKGDKSIYILFNYRDPRDVLVSWYYWRHPRHGGSMHLYQEYMRKVYSHFTDDEMIDILIRIDKFREVEYNPIEHFRLSRVLLFHPGVLKIRFEDLVGPEGGGHEELQRMTIGKICHYLGCEDADIDTVVHRAFDRSSKTFRRGQTGDYKTVLSRKQLRLFNELHGDIIKQYGYMPDDLEEI